MLKIKKQKAKRKWVVKRKLKFKDYKNCSGAAQIENRIYHLGKNKIEKLKWW